MFVFPVDRVVSVTKNEHYKMQADLVLLFLTIWEPYSNTSP